MNSSSARLQLFGYPELFWKTGRAVLLLVLTTGGFGGIVTAKVSFPKGHIPANVSLTEGHIRLSAG